MYKVLCGKHECKQHTNLKKQTITLVYAHVEVTMRERKLLRGHSDSKKNTRVKTSINLLKRLMKNILSLVVVYEVLIKLGSGSRIVENCRI